jgi:hypothetical protein
MAATNVKIKNSGDKVYGTPFAVGTGAIAATDELVTSTSKYPIGSRYLDTTNKRIYYRCAETTGGAIGDWYLEDLTQAS